MILKFSSFLCSIILFFFSLNNCFAQENKTAIVAQTPIVSQNNKDIPPIHELVPVAFQQIGEAAGIPNYIGNITKDRKGFLWMASSSGVIRFDGIRSKIYKHNPLDTEGLSNSIIRGVFIDQSDNPWAIAVDYQLHRYDSQLESFRKMPLLSDNITEDKPIKPTFLLEDSHGIFWLSTSSHGLHQLNPATGQLLQVPISKYLPNEDLTSCLSLMEDQQGNIWGTGKQLFCISFQEKNRTIKEITTYPEIGPYVIKTVSQDQQGYIWVLVADKEIVRLRPSSRAIKRFVYAPNDGIDNIEAAETYINYLFIAANGNIWVGTPSDGIKILNPLSGEFTTLRNNPDDVSSISGNFIASIYGDETGVMWASTWGNGLNQYTPSLAQLGTFQSISSQENTLSDNTVRSFYEATDSLIWIGVEDGLNTFNRKTGDFTRYPLPPSFSYSRPNLFLSLTENTVTTPRLNDNILIGSYNGLMTFNPRLKKYSKWKAPSKALLPLETAGMLSITKNNKGILWALTFAPYGIFRFDTLQNTFRPIDLIHQTDTLDQIANMIPDQQQHYWITTDDQRLFQLDLNTQQLTPFDIQSDSITSFPATRVRSFLLDQQNRQWVGTDLGLFLLNPTGEKKHQYRFKQFTKLDGLPNSIISSILEDEQGLIWMSTPNGLSSLDTKTMTFKNYKKSDGLQDNYFNYYAAFKSPSTNNLYFGGNKGFNVFDPLSIQKDSIAPKVVLTDITVYRDSTKQKVIPTLSDYQENIPTIRLTYQDKILEINYTALQFIAPKLNQYAVRLEGFEQNWRQVGTDIEATYTNLDAGTYYFLIKAANKDRVWSEQSAVLKVIVLPPWWETWWAYTAYALLSIGGLYYLYLFQRKRDAERAEVHRIKEMEMLKSRFFTNVSHELRTPLTLILGPINAALKRNKLAPQDFAFLKMARRNGNQLLLLVNSILDLSKMEVNQLTLQETVIDFYSLMNRLVAAFESAATIQGINLIYKSPPATELSIQLDAPKFEVIINNLLSNALKFTPKGGKIEVQVQIHQDQIEIKVTDTGKGIAAEDLPFIFDRYFQTKKSTQTLQGGTGIGLALCKEYAQLFKGEMSVSSVLGESSTFTFIFPKKEATAVLIPIESKVTPTIEDHPIELLPTPTTNRQKEKPNLLIVEDNKDMRLYIQTILGNTFQCYTAENGQVAWDWLNDATKSQPDLIISDLMMPFLDGFELLEKIKAHDKWRTIPFIMLTARSTKEDRLKALTIGIDDYLTKPFEAEELVVRVTTLLQNHLARKLQFQSRSPLSSLTKEMHAEFKSATSADIEWLRQVRETIKEDIGKVDLNLLSIAGKMAISERHLRRRILEITGMNAGAYLKEIKLQQARHFLESKAYKSVAEVGYAVGFNTPSYFAKIYKARFGKLPSAYF